MTQDEALYQLGRSFSQTIRQSVLAGPVQISPLDPNDAPAIQEAGSDPAVFRYIPSIQTPFDAASWCQKALQATESYVCHKVQLKESGLIIGYTQINRRANCDLELGYWIDANRWGKGYGTLAAQAAIWLLRTKGCREPIYAATFPENVASRRILGRLGFVETTASECPKGMIDHVLTR